MSRYDLHQVPEQFCRSSIQGIADLLRPIRFHGLYAGKNKWLLAHADSDEAKKGLYVGLKGENLQYK